MTREKLKSVDFSSQNDRVLFTIKDRSVITRECLHSDEHSWKGSRRGFSIVIQYNAAEPAATRINWQVCLKRKWHEGFCAMISDAMACVEQKVANRDLDARQSVEKSCD